jgi:hypothetical protein
MRLRSGLVFALVTAACGSTHPAAVPSGTVNAPPQVTGGAREAAGSRDAGEAEKPYQAKPWIAKLGDPRESERAVTELEQLGDASAIGALGEAWADQGKPVHMLQVIISLARPLTPEEAKARFLTDYETSGRPARWDRALPFLIRALAEVDDANPRSVACAVKAADALGEARLPGGLDAVIEIARKPITRKLVVAQIAAIRVLGKLPGEPTAGAALLEIIDRPPPSHPRAGKDQAQRRALEDSYGLFLAGAGAAINAIGELRVGSAARPLVLALYRTPELFTQVRRALVASGPSAEQALLKVLRGESAEVNQLFKDQRLDRYCGDQGDAPPARCHPVSARDFYAAAVLGDFYDPATVPDLLAALKRPAAPAYYLDDQPSPNTQYHAVFDALRKIGAAEAAGPVRAMWLGVRARARQPALTTRILAIGAYPFVTRDGAGTDELGKIAADNTADDTLRQEAAAAFARLSRAPKDIDLLRRLAQKYLDASAAKTKRARQAAGPQKTRAAVHKTLESAAKAYQGYARMFQTHIARIEIALRCQADLSCYAASLTQSPGEAAANNAKYIQDLPGWSEDEKRELAAAAIERAMLELGKQGTGASQLTGALLDAAGSEVRLIRQSILLALPKIAALPCASCEAALDAVIRAGEGKTALANLDLETAIVRNYFSWAGGKPAAGPGPK